MRRFAKPLYGLTPVPRVRIPPSPPILLVARVARLGRAGLGGASGNAFPSIMAGFRAHSFDFYNVYSVNVLVLQRLFYAFGCATAAQLARNRA
jgi:hypothetical protein